MILKPLTEPLLIPQLESLYLRLPPNHSKKELVQYDLAKEKKGYRGEKALEFPLSFLPENEFFILHHLRIPESSGFFQMDKLILCERFFLIIEVKNWDGIFYFDENNQVYRIDTEKNEGYQNPITQVKLQRLRLINWLKDRNIKDIPIEYLVVYSFTDTILKAPNPNILQKVIHGPELNFKIEDISKRYVSPLVPKQKLRQLARKLKNVHTPLKEDLLNKYKIHKNELLRGVICLSCKEALLKYRYGSWLCKNCGASSHNAHLQSLNDYYLLINTKITNKEARNFLMLDSPHVVKYLLKKHYSFNGSTSNRKYILDLK